MCKNISISYLLILTLETWQQTSLPYISSDEVKAYAESSSTGEDMEGLDDTSFPNDVVKDGKVEEIPDDEEEDQGAEDTPADSEGEMLFFNLFYFFFDEI